MQDKMKHRKEYNRDTRAINRYMKKKNLDLALQIRVNNYLDYLHKKGSDILQEEEDNVVKKLSNNIISEIRKNQNIKIIRNYPIFLQNFSEFTISKLLFIMKEINFNPEETIIRENVMDDCSIYFILSGEIEIYHDQNRDQSEKTVLKILNQGDLFGEISFFTGLNRTASAKSTDFSTLFCISRQDFIEILQESEVDYEKFCQLKDEVVNNNNLKCLNVSCYSCKQMGHQVKDCQFLHYSMDKLKYFEKMNFSRPNHREKRNRSKVRKQNAIHLITKHKDFLKRIKHEPEMIELIDKMNVIFEKTDKIYSDSDLQDDQDSQTGTQLSLSRTYSKGKTLQHEPNSIDIDLLSEDQTSILQAQQQQQQQQQQQSQLQQQQQEQNIFFNPNVPSMSSSSVNPASSNGSQQSIINNSNNNNQQQQALSSSQMLALSSQLGNFSSQLISNNTSQQSMIMPPSQNSGPVMDEDTNSKKSLTKASTPRINQQKKSMENRFQINDIVPAISVFNPSRKNSRQYSNRQQMITDSEVYQRSNSQRIVTASPQEVEEELINKSKRRPSVQQNYQSPRSNQQPLQDECSQISNTFSFDPQSYSGNIGSNINNNNNKSGKIQNNSNQYISDLQSDDQTSLGKTIKNKRPSTKQGSIYMEFPDDINQVQSNIGKQKRIKSSNNTSNNPSSNYNIEIQPSSQTRKFGYSHDYDQQNTQDMYNQISREFSTQNDIKRYNSKSSFQTKSYNAVHYNTATSFAPAFLDTWMWHFDKPKIFQIYYPQYNIDKVVKIIQFLYRKKKGRISNKKISTISHKKSKYHQSNGDRHVDNI